MGTVNVTVRVDEEIKRDFDSFCDNVGINITTAFNMFIKETLRTRQLPFIVTDVETQNRTRQELQKAFSAAQKQSVVNGTDKMTMEEIDAEIAAYRREKRAARG
ncbi:MAG: type II toxin-antitoxin system RelB/DinJ family antitoxin [Gracilibacteraceae bacterium]|jgi:DNA-damage-inducible protein J|nr:type II toxin-antitoxin system RelB/DinJ family antitoxin [Gracilibacteraceae bacterium]